MLKMRISRKEEIVLVYRLLNEGLTGGPNSIKRQDYFALMAYMSRQPTGREVAWKFYTKSYPKLVKV